MYMYVYVCICMYMYVSIRRQQLIDNACLIKIQMRLKMTYFEATSFYLPKFEFNTMTGVSKDSNRPPLSDTVY